MVSDKIEKKKHIRILFDTSAIKPSTDVYFINSELTKFIEEYSMNQKFKISVHLAEMVKFEREYQMQLKGKELLKSIRNYETLFGYKLDLTQAKIEKRIKQVIDDDIKKYEIDIITLV